MSNDPDSQNNQAIIEDMVERSVLLRAKGLESNTEKLNYLKELVGVFVNQHLNLFYDAADAVKANNPSEISSVITRLQAEFAKLQCRLVADNTLQSDNPASLAFDQSGWQLRVHPDHMAELSFDVVKEYVHELGALMMLKHLAQKNSADLTQPGVLRKLKDSLIVNPEADDSSKLAATNVVDLVFRFESGQMQK